MAARVLIVDDDATYRTSIRRALTLHGFSTFECASGQAAIDLLARDAGWDVVLLDVDMPLLDGLEVCTRLRADGVRIPILLLTGRDAVPDKVVGLDSGADDYLTKDISIVELLARIRSAIRRGSMRLGDDPATNDRRLHFADLTFDLDTMEMTRGSAAPVQLSRTESRLLEQLMRSPRHVLSRESIYEHVWGADLSGSSNSLEVFISSLRSKLEHGQAARIVHTVRGVGYQLREPDGST